MTREGSLASGCSKVKNPNCLRMCVRAFENGVDLLGCLIYRCLARLPFQGVGKICQIGRAGFVGVENGLFLQSGDLGDTFTG